MFNQVNRADNWNHFFSDINIQKALKSNHANQLTEFLIKKIEQAKVPKEIQLRSACRVITALPSDENHNIDKIMAALVKGELFPEMRTICWNGLSSDVGLCFILHSAIENAIKDKRFYVAKSFFLKLDSDYKVPQFLHLLLEHLPDPELISLALDLLPCWKALDPPQKELFFRRSQESFTYRIPLLRTLVNFFLIIPSSYYLLTSAVIAKVIPFPEQFLLAAESEQSRLCSDLDGFVNALSYLDQRSYFSLEIAEKLIGIPLEKRVKAVQVVNSIGFCLEKDLLLNLDAVAGLPEPIFDEALKFYDLALECFEIAISHFRVLKSDVKRSVIKPDYNFSHLVSVCFDNLNINEEGVIIEEVERLLSEYTANECEKRKRLLSALRECRFLSLTPISRKVTCLNFLSRLSAIEIDAIVKFYKLNEEINQYAVDREGLLEVFYEIPDGEILEILQCAEKLINEDDAFNACALVCAVRDLPRETRLPIVNEISSAMQTEDRDCVIHMLTLVSHLDPLVINSLLYSEHYDVLMSLYYGIDLSLMESLRKIPEEIFSKLCFLYYFQDLDMLGWEGVQKMAEVAAQCEDLEEVEFYTLLEEIFSDHNFQERALKRLSERLNDEFQSLHIRYYTALEIVDYDYYLGLHYEHEIYQQALEVLSTCNPAFVNDPKFPYTLFKKLSLSVPSEPWIVFDVPRETVMLKILDVSREDTTVLKTIPVDVSWDVAAIRNLNDWKGYTKEHLRVLLQGVKGDVNLKALLTLIKNFERRLKGMGADEKQVVHDRIMSSYGLTYSKIKEQLLHPQLRKWLNLDETAQVVPTTSFQLIAIIRFFMESGNEENLLGFGASIGNCDTGQADGISNYYTTFLPLEYKMGVRSNEHSSVDYVEELFECIFQGELQKVFAGEELARTIVGDDSLDQMSHFARYLKNRFHRQAGLKDTIEFDGHTGVLSNKLLQADPKRVLEGIYRLFAFEPVFKKILNESVKFFENLIFYSGIRTLICRGKPGAKEGITVHEFDKTVHKYFVFDEYKIPLRLTPEGLFKTLKALDWISVHNKCE